MKNQKTWIEDNFDNLREYYPNIIELFAREQFYRNNRLPNEINDTIENYCLDLSCLSGKETLTKMYIEYEESELKFWDYNKESYEFWNKLEEWTKNRSKIEEKREKQILNAWDSDKKDFSFYKIMAFSSLYSTTKNRKELGEIHSNKKIVQEQNIEEIKPKEDWTLKVTKDIIWTSIFSFLIFWILNKISKNMKKNN